LIKVQRIDILFNYASITGIAPAMDGTVLSKSNYSLKIHSYEKGLFNQHFGDMAADINSYGSEWTIRQ
jgi:hypothetical protein